MAEDEILDQINKSDEVIGTTTKERAHQNGHIHRVAVVYFFDATGKLYLQKVGHKKLYDHSVGGHVTRGESYIDAATRETLEELNIETRLRFLGKLYSDESSAHDKFRHMYAIYMADMPKTWKFVPNKEVKCIESLPLPNILKLAKSSPDKFTPGFLATFSYVATRCQQLFST